MGRWHYELSTLNAIERTAVKIFYGAYRQHHERINHCFEKQVYYQWFILNYFEMAKAYYKNDEKDKAIQTLKKMLDVPNQTEDDPIIKSDGKKLLDGWR